MCKLLGIIFRLDDSEFDMSAESYSIFQRVMHTEIKFY